MEDRNSRFSIHFDDTDKICDRYLALDLVEQVEGRESVIEWRPDILAIFNKLVTITFIFNFKWSESGDVDCNGCKTQNVDNMEEEKFEEY